MTRVGVVGLGGMGQALAVGLLAGGHEVSCYDRRPAAVDVMVDCGCASVASARQVAERSELVFTSLPGPAEVRAVALDPESGVLAGLAPGGALFETSTCGPDVAEELAPVFDRVDRLFVDCPVSGRAPSMTVLAGGDSRSLGRFLPIVQEVSSAIVYCGRSGAGYAVKLLNQHVKYSWYLAASEALLVAKRMGLDVAVVAEAIEASSGGTSGFRHAAEYYRPETTGTKRRAPASTIEKDLLLAEEMARAAGVDAPSLAVVADFFRAAGATRFRRRPYPESNDLLEALRTGGSAESE